MALTTFPLRLILRQEGDWWVAYAAAPGTMKDATELGRIRLGLVGNEERKQMFIELMKHAIGEFIKEMTGLDPSQWDITGAPESERSGTA